MYWKAEAELAMVSGTALENTVQTRSQVHTQSSMLIFWHDVIVMPISIFGDSLAFHLIMPFPRKSLPSWHNFVGLLCDTIYRRESLIGQVLIQLRFVHPLFAKKLRIPSFSYFLSPWHVHENENENGKL